MSRESGTPRTSPQGEAIADLQERGGHFVICRGKVPIWPRWQRRRPPLDLVLEHGPEIGLIPWSLGTTALDLDWGLLGQLVQATDPLAILPSPRGAHLYFEDREGRANGSWSAFSAGGEVRGSRGFVRLYDDGPVLLADALGSDPRPGKPFPADLFEAAGVAGDMAGVAVEPPRIFRVRIPEGLPLEAALPGVRNSTLFDHLRFSSYSASKGDSVTRWHRTVHDLAESMNARMPEPLGAPEVARTAYSVSSWCWAGGGPIDHSPAAQRRRGIKSGRARRRATRERDGRIVVLAIEGLTQATIGEAVGCPQTTVAYVLRRDCPMFAPGRGRNQY